MIISTQALLEKMEKLKLLLKAFINSIRIPSLLSFFITKDGKINPTLDEALAQAPEASQNWDRLGMETKVIGNFPRWAVFILCLTVVVVNLWSEILTNALKIFEEFMLSTNSFPSGMALPFKYSIEGLIYLITFLSKFGGLAPLLVIGYFIVKSFKKN